MSAQKKNIVISLSAWLKEMFFTRRMNSVPGWIVMAIVGVGLAYSGNINDKLPVIIASGGIAVLFLLICMRYPEFAYYVYVYSIIIFTVPARLFGINLPLGLLIEPTGYLAALSILAAQYRKRKNSADFWKTPISLMMLLIFSFYILECF